MAGKDIDVMLRLCSEGSGDVGRRGGGEQGSRAREERIRAVGSRKENRVTKIREEERVDGRTTRTYVNNDTESSVPQRQGEFIERSSS